MLGSGQGDDSRAQYLCVVELAGVGERKKWCGEAKPTAFRNDNSKQVVRLAIYAQTMLRGECGQEMSCVLLSWHAWVRVRSMAAASNLRKQAKYVVCQS